MNIMRNSRFDIDVASAHEVLISVRDYRLANKLNKILQKYPDYRLRDSEEAQFRVGVSKWAPVGATLSVGSDLFRKIDSSLKNGFQL